MRKPTRCRAIRASRSGAPVVAAVAIFALLVVAGCGATTAAPQGIHADSLSRIRAAVGITEATGSAHFVVDIEITRIAPSPQITGQHLVGAGDVHFAGPDIKLVTGAADPPSGDRTRVWGLRIGDAVYQSTSPTGVHWQRVDVAAANLDYLGGVTPAALEHASGPVLVLGRATIGGRRTIEYGVALPAGTDSRSGTGTAVQHVTIAPTIAHVWLDATGRIVQTVVTVDATIASPATGPGGQSVPQHSLSTTTDTLSMFGEPLHLHAPITTG